MGELLWAVALALVAWVLIVGKLVGRRWPAWHWYLSGYPVMAVRVLVTWRKVCHVNDLTVSYQPSRRLLGDLVVRGEALRGITPRARIPLPVPGGLRLRVRLLPGQTPARFLEAAEAMAHAWRAHSVRVTSPERGVVVIVVSARDPLAEPHDDGKGRTGLLAAVLGRLETGAVWTLDFRRVPHWLVVGATRSGKSTLLARLVSQLAPQPVALVGIDCKGGMELGLFAERLSVLATTRRQALAVLGELVNEMQRRMITCRFAGVRSIWDLEEETRPVPVVVLVDELAELYLTNGSREDRAEAERCSTHLLRLAQLGAALGVHLVIAGQRVGSDLGPGVTALRAQLGGRICHRVNDPGTAEMALGDLHKDAVAVAQSIRPDEEGVAVTGADSGGWVRGRSYLTTPDQAREAALTHADHTPRLPMLTIAVELSEES
ncbi:FtsK/SpoIIIE domain-containing protein [Streptomyces sp. 4N509B]|uniref:FtsK/SpoIIIE domain-containing protein n=1 Tax=Streptomyces sp. 4N509B TaxID=3457413 RepID=UPI003FD6A194